MRTDVCQKPRGMARAWESDIAKLLVCNTVLYQVSCIQKEPVLCPRAFCSLWVEFLQLLGQQCASVRLFARLPKKEENQVTVLSITYELRGQNPCLMEKKKGKRGGRTSFYHLQDWCSWSHSLCHKFMFIVLKCIVLYVILLNFILFLLLMNHGYLALSLWYAGPYLCTDCVPFQQHTTILSA